MKKFFNKVQNKANELATKKITTNESGNDAKREKVRVIPIQFFDDFPKHPFNVKMDTEMEALIESINSAQRSLSPVFTP